MPNVADMSEREQKIRKRAEELWENAGKPVGRDEEFWGKAEIEVDTEISRQRNIPRR